MELLRVVMSNSIFDDFTLVGGTSLALQIGHRNSIDIDLFGNARLLPDEFISFFEDYGKVLVTTKSKKIMQLSVNNIKVDLVDYSYPLIAPIQKIDNLKLISKEDIAAMKLNAIAGRGSKKDFIDLYFLLQYFSLEEMLKFYKAKYDDGNVFLVLKSLNYFEDAEEQITPKMFTDFDWEKGKAFIVAELNKLLNNL
jgi:hypothetical protein